jgi:hypothetical protein
LVGEFFEVRTHVDRDLTTVSRVDRRLGLIKNLGRHIRDGASGTDGAVTVVVMTADGAATARCTSSAVAACCVSATVADCCSSVADAACCGPAAAVAPREPSLAAVAVLPAARNALDERRLVGTAASDLSTLAGVRGGMVGATLRT